MDTFQKFSEFCRSNGAYSIESYCSMYHCFYISCKKINEVSDILKNTGVNLKKKNKETMSSFEVSIEFDPSHSISVYIRGDKTRFYCKFSKSPEEIKELDKKIQKEMNEHSTPNFLKSE